MDKRLKEILKKVAGQQPLGDDALQVIKGLVADDDGAATADGPMPLWFWVRRQFLLNQRWLDFYLDDNVDLVLLDAGADASALPPYAHEYRPFAMVSLDGLLRGVRRHLNNEDAMRRAYATRLVGLCRLFERKFGNFDLQTFLRNQLHQLAGKLVHIFRSFVIEVIAFHGLRLKQ